MEWICEGLNDAPGLLCGRLEVQEVKEVEEEEDPHLPWVEEMEGWRWGEEELWLVKAWHWFAYNFI